MALHPTTPPVVGGGREDPGLPPPPPNGNGLKTTEKVECFIRGQSLGTLFKYMLVNT